MTQWPIQRNIYTLVSSNKSNETTHILTTHNTNTPSRIATTTTTTSASSSSNVYDDSLTNLSWLHDINILKRTIPTINSSSSTNNSGNNIISNKRKEQSLVNNSLSSSSSIDGTIYPNDIDDNNDLNLNNDDNDEQWKFYKINPQAKPVYSYSQLILLAMKQSGYEKMTLQMIYEWVAENFPYFKKMEPTWQNSIRHNLSLNKCFIKVPRTKKEAGGKGGFWKLSPDYQKQYLQNKISTNEKQLNSPSNKRIRSSKRSINISESWIDPILQCHTDRSSSSSSSYIRMPSSFLSPVSSPDPLTISSFYHQQQINNDFSSVLTPSPSTSPSSMSSKQNIISTKLDETDILLLDSSIFDLDAYLNETPNDIDVQSFLSTKTEQDLFNDFNAALTDLTYSAETAAADGDTSAFDGFDYPTKTSTFHSLFDDEEQQQQQQQQSQPQSLTIKGRGIKRPIWWLNNDNSTQTKLPSLETAFDLKLSK